MWYSLVRPLLFKLEPEQAHYFSFSLLKKAYPRAWREHYCTNLPTKPVTICGLRFPNPIGIAAGLDKNGDYIELLHGLGCGFVEVGTVTPQPQSGNPKPRLFRIPSAQALINRMGFNNLGVDYLVARLQQRQRGCIVGANIGKNKTTPLTEAATDYCYCLAKVYPYVDYVTINISSPNTPELRQLQSERYLQDFLAAIQVSRQQLETQYQRRVPLWLKIAPDLTLDELKTIVDLLLLYQFDAVVATNTTLDHQDVANVRYGNESGGLSGAPLFERSTATIQQLNQLLQGQLPIIAVGGIMNAKQALAKLAAGASLIQLYTGLIYQGPGLIKDILIALP